MNILLDKKDGKKMFENSLCTWKGAKIYINHFQVSSTIIFEITIELLKFIS